MVSMELVSLRELCKIVGVSRRSIQCYENEGLMTYTDKNKYGHLLYNEDMLKRAKMIRFMQEVGFMLKDIKGLIDAPPSKMREAFEMRLPELEIEKAHMQELIDEVRKYIEELRLMS